MNDKELLSAKIASQSAKSSELPNEISIDGETYKLAPREFPPDFQLLLPDGLEELDPEQAKIKYPYENRPAIILSNTDTTVNFAFDCLERQHGDLQTRLTNYKAFVKKQNRDYVFFTEMIYEPENGLKVACFDYSGSLSDGDIYFMCFFTDLPTGEMFGWFSCPAELQSKWEPPVRRMIQTIKPLSES